MPDTCYACHQKLPKRITQVCDECGGKWADGIAGCPHCGDGNPFKGIRCLTPSVSSMAKSAKE